MFKRSWRSPLLLFFLSDLALLAAVLLFLALDSRDLFDPWLVCPLHRIGLYCPTCGMTRALHRLLALDPLGALRCHPCLPAVLACLLTYEIAALRAALRRDPAPLRRVGLRPLFLLLGLLVLWSVGVNIARLAFGFDFLGDFS